MFPQSVRVAAPNSQQMESGLQKNVVPRQSFGDLDRWMERYQQADPDAPATLVGALSPALLRFFKSQVATREQADDLLQQTWLRIHRVRHPYRPGEPVLPWIYAIARRVRVDGYRRTRRITLHEIAMDVLRESKERAEARNPSPTFDTLVAALPEVQREVVTMLKVGGLTLEEVARATSSRWCIRWYQAAATEFSPRLLPVGITISLIVAIAVLFQFQHERDFWGNAWACIRAGTPIGVLAAVPFWLVLRRGAILSPSITGAATGLLAGLVGASVLEIHCPNLGAWHILVSHLGVAILCALAGLFASLTAESIGGRSIHHSKTRM
jgi:RNA polymerase sigma-70 factor (ECF subfamily)